MEREIEIWISKFLGPVFIVLATPMIFNPGNLNEVTERFLEDKPLVLFSGVLAMIAGLSIVNSYNTWQLNWTLVITLFGWALTIGGALRIVMPGAVIKIGRSMTGSPIATKIAGVAWLILGVFLTYKGYL